MEYCYERVDCSDTWMYGCGLVTPHNSTHDQKVNPLSHLSHRSSTFGLLAYVLMRDDDDVGESNGYDEADDDVDTDEGDFTCG